MSIAGSSGTNKIKEICKEKRFSRLGRCGLVEEFQTSARLEAYICLARDV
jgi:hypothetical protein